MTVTLLLIYVIGSNGNLMPGKHHEFDQRHLWWRPCSITTAFPTQRHHQTSGGAVHQQAEPVLDWWATRPGGWDVPSARAFLIRILISGNDQIENAQMLDKHKLLEEKLPWTMHKGDMTTDYNPYRTTQKVNCVKSWRAGCGKIKFI